ncbi:hypothetical protein L484_022323 [Morus notabilis]|uniref:Uncharacterized protein n=1 Tax=Morus notabilis TaxID=981085 RepID=W9QU30_9ROSA|nr:hypothetical protein L484_022323 [Morus notabilis]
MTGIPMEFRRFGFWSCEGGFGNSVLVFTKEEWTVDRRGLENTCGKCLKSTEIVWTLVAKVVAAWNATFECLTLVKL